MSYPGSQVATYAQARIFTRLRNVRGRLFVSIDLEGSTTTPGSKPWPTPQNRVFFMSDVFFVMAHEDTPLQPSIGHERKLEVASPCGPLSLEARHGPLAKDLVCSPPRSSGSLVIITPLSRYWTPFLSDNSCPDNYRYLLCHRFLKHACLKPNYRVLGPCFCH